MSLLYPRQSAPSQIVSSAEVKLTTAPHYFGSICGWLFLGLMLVQTNTYYRKYERDPWHLKLFVFSTVFIQIVQSALETNVGYHYLVEGWDNEATLLVPWKPLLFQPLLVALVGLLVQNYFSWRIWVFGRGVGASFFLKIVCVFLCLLGLVALACATAIPVTLLTKHSDESMLFDQVHVVTAIWLVCSCVADMTITICMIIILRSAKSRSSFQETQDRISRSMHLTIQSGALTSALALTILILFFEIHIGNMYTWPAYILGKSYVMSLLSNLNARGDKTVPRLSMMSFAPSGSKNLSFGTAGRTGNLSVPLQSFSGSESKTDPLRTQQSISEELDHSKTNYSIQHFESTHSVGDLELGRHNHGVRFKDPPPSPRGLMATAI